MIDIAWCDMAVAVYSGMVRDRHHFAQAAYRDGQWYFMLDRPGTNINGETYDPQLGAALRHTLLEPVGQWCVFWAPQKIGAHVRKAAVRWIEQHKPAVHWIPDRPIGNAVIHGRAAPFFAACRSRRVVLVGPQHLARFGLFPIATHIVVPDATAWQHVDRLSAEITAVVRPDDLVLFCAGHASNLLIHQLWPAVRGTMTLMDLGATLDPFVGAMSRGAYRTAGWVENVMPRNEP